MKSKLPNQLKPNLKPGQNVKLVGLGGVGSIVARYLTIFMAATRKRCTLTLIDGDEFEPSNASRMFFGDYGNKAQVILKEILPRVKDTRMDLLAVEEYITIGNLKELLREGDIVLLSVDNHSTRKLVSAYCGTIKNIVLISGGNDGAGPDSSGKVLRGTYGNVQVYIRRDGQDITPSLARFHDEIASPKDKHPEDISCTEALVSVPQLMITNLAVASAILNTFYLHICNATHFAEASLDIADMLMQPTLPVKLKDQS